MTQSSEEVKRDDDDDISHSAFSNVQLQHLDTQLKKTFFAQNALRLRDFIGVREREIVEMQRTLATKQMGSRMSRTRVFQTLPRHMRRRAMSFNLHLLPRHLRKAAAKEMVMPAKVKTRRRRKYRRRMRDHEEMCAEFESPIEEFCHSQTAHDGVGDDESGKEMALSGKRRDKRLATHVYHAKRMHMLSLWGHLLAYESTQKIFRVSYRFMRQHCTIHDASYLICLQLEADTQNTIAEMLEKRCNGSIVRNRMYWSGRREGEFEMRAVAAANGPYESMGSVRFQWKQTERDNVVNGSDPCMWLWVHPASLPNSYTALKNAAKEHNGK